LISFKGYTVTPMHLVCYVYNKKNCKIYLLKYGANVNIYNNDGETPLNLLCYAIPLSELF